MSPDEQLERPEPALTPARIERQWANVRDRLEAGGAVRPWWALGLAAWLAVGLVALGSWQLGAWQPGGESSTTTLAEGSAVETTHEPVRVALEEGTLIDVGAESRLAVEETRGEDVAVRIDRGEARFDVAHRSSGAFRVHAATARGEDVEVVVVGTAFTVAHEDAEVSVRVERGIVEVHAAGRVERLTAGDAWRSSATEARGETERAPEGSLDTSGSASEGSPSASEGLSSASEGLSSASEGLLATPQDVAPDRRATRRRESLDARSLFEQAREARQAGSVAEAARLYGEIVARHDDDPRADVAAFELARLRMDHLGDPRGALRALDRALSGGGAFREYAMARRAVLLDRLGRERECRSAREAYLAAFGAGVHRAEVGALCP
jgi:transmembrane sensor